MRTFQVFSCIVLVLLGSALLAGCDQLTGGADPAALPVSAPVTQQDDMIIAEGHVVPGEEVGLFFTVSGKVAEVLVAEGDLVSKGDVLARLGDRQQAEAGLAAAELELTDAQQAVDDLLEKAGLAYAQAWLEATAANQASIDAQEALDELDTQDYQDRIDDARLKVSDAQDVLTDAQEEFDKYADLDSDNADRKRAEDALEDAQDKYNQAVRERDRLVNDLDTARANAELARTRLEDAIRSRDARQDGPDPDTLALAQSRLDNAQAQLAAAQAALANYDLLAPFDGTLVKLDISVGEQVLPNQKVLVLADLSQWYVETSDLTENDVVQLAEGQSASITPDALPDLVLNGKVESISDTYMEKAGDITYMVRILLTDTDARLRWGMTVEVRLEPAAP
jgi:multidrug resistance efflux pump